MGKENVVIDSIDLAEYYDLADEMVDRVVDREIRRFKENVKRLQQKGITIKEQDGLDYMSKTMYQIAIVVSTAFQKRLFNLLTTAENKAILRFMEGSKNDVGRHP